MDIDVFPRRNLDLVFRVLRTALGPGEVLDDRGRRFLETYARITGYALGQADPREVDFWEVRIDSDHERKRLLQLSALAVLLSHPVKPASVRFLRGLSTQLGVDDSSVLLIEFLLRKKYLPVRM